MLAEYLDGAPQALWQTVMPGARACLFSLDGEESSSPGGLPPRLEQMHFEVLFCLKGSVTLVRRDGTALTAGPRQVLLLAGGSALAGGRLERPASGVLVAVDARQARESLEALCALLGLTLDTGQVRRRMDRKGGCELVGRSPWSQSAFEHLARLPQAERGRWCVLKSVELLYLLCAPEEGAPEEGPLARTVADLRRYMEEHLDEPLTIPALSRRCCLSPTALKCAFRRMYGQSIHAWLRDRRLERAAELLRTSRLSVLGVAQAVGYGSASQFSAAFRQRYGTAPGQYRKNV